jgi:DNA-binding response OmpR family regulator
MNERPAILVVDDNDALRLAVGQFLSARGCRITTAANGLQGLRAIRREKFDVVITDLEMPEGGGVWLWERAVKVHPRLQGRFVFTTGEPSPPARSMGLYIGSERFSLKPLSLPALWNQVQDILHRSTAPANEPADDSEPAEPQTPRDPASS